MTGKLKYAGSAETVTVERWQQHVDELRRDLEDEGLSPDDVAVDLRSALGDISFTDQTGATWRYDGCAWWSWVGETWREGRPTTDVSIRELSFDMESWDEVPVAVEELASEYPDQADEEVDKVAPVPRAPVVPQPHVAFRATHTAPTKGLRTWPEPGAQASGPSLDPHLAVSVTQVWGDWAHIRCENGWEAWVDNRQLVAVGGAAAPMPSVAPVAAAPAAAGAAKGSANSNFVRPSRATLVTTLGAGALAVGSFLPWVDYASGTATVSAHDVPVGYLFDYKNTTGGLKIGLLLLVIAAGAFLAQHMQGQQRWTKPVATLGAAITAMFVVQEQRLLGAIPESNAPSLFDVLGAGVWVALAGSALLVFGNMQQPRGKS